MKKIALLTSGGDAPGMNACIRAVVIAAAKIGMEVLGIKRGYQGLLENDFTELDFVKIQGIIQKGGTILGSARSETFKTAEGRKQAYLNLKKAEIEGLIVIGGDGTFKGAKILMEEFPEMSVVGLPGTIDNDLFGTDYTIGYDTALNTAMNAIDKIRDTADAHHRLFLVEVMGRDAGFIALRSGIATGAESILVPEFKTDLNELISEINSVYRSKNSSCIVVVAEGDDAGHAFEIVKNIKNLVDYEDIRVVVLGHVQRGGSPTCFDRVLSSRLGIAAVKALKDGKKGIMIGQSGLKTVEIPFEKAIKHHQKLSPYLVEMMEILTT
jgi:6-phosphofructokinase 1